MMNFSQLAEIVDGRLIGGDGHFVSVSTDSRAIVAGDLFVALRGEYFDGAKFVRGAAMDGAVAALVNADSFCGETACPQILVDDTRLALGVLAAHWRSRFPVPLVGITGSNGKTTVKEMLAGILREHLSDDDAVLATKGNLNNDIGLPLTLLKLRPHHRYAVIEMGMNHPGEIHYLSNLAKPDVALVNNAGSAHLAGLGTVAAVAAAKGEIFSGLGALGVAIINADDDHAALWRTLAADHPVISFALEHPAEIRADWQPRGLVSQLTVQTPEETFEIELNVPGIHNARNALAAIAAARALAVPAVSIVRGLNAFSGVAGRLQRKAALKGALLIDDTYNANPASLHAALEVLAQRPGKRILVLGDMGELGAEAARLHAEIGVEAKQLGIQQLLALGDLTTYTVDEFGAGAQHFERIEMLLSSLEEHLGEETTVLVKGSRFMKMERVVQHCTALQ